MWVTEETASWSCSRNAWTARAGRLPAKGNKHGQVRHLCVCWIVSHVRVFTGVPAAQELVSTQTYQRPRLLVEEPSSFLAAQDLRARYLGRCYGRHSSSPPQGHRTMPRQFSD